MEASLIEMQAENFANIPIIEPRYRASVHLENKADETFWDAQLQSVRPREYNYIYFSKNEKGNDTAGSTQCLKYRKWLNKRFFVCVDSDYHYLKEEPDFDAQHYIFQTYSYSWENHYCYATKLQLSLASQCPEVAKNFCFISFLQRYSTVVYKPLLLFLFMNKKGWSHELTKDNFHKLLTVENHFSLDEDAVIDRLSTKLTRFIDPLIEKYQFDFEAEKKYYQRLGLNESNAYLHSRGHNLTGILINIGDQLCKGVPVCFKNHILYCSLSHKGYWEIDRIGKEMENYL